MGRHPSVRSQPPCRNGQRPASGDHADADQEPQTACNTAHVTLASRATDAGRMRRHATMPPERPPRRPAIEVGGFNSGILARMGGTFGRACPWPPGGRIGAALSCNPDQAVLAVAPPRTGRSSPEKACCSQSTIGEAM